MKSKPVFGIEFSLQTRREVAEDALSFGFMDKFESRLLITPNVDHIIILHENTEYRAACDYAWKLTVDGFPVERFLRLVGVNIPERVTGADLFPEIMQGLDPTRHRPCFAVATEETKHFIENWLKAHGFDDQTSLVEVPPFGFEKNEEFARVFIAKMKSVSGSHLFMGVGAPKSEIWAYQHRAELANTCTFCFGAGIEFFSKNLKRAPVWMQENGLEWVWRLCSEPKRLAKRYLINSWKFFYFCGKEFFANRLR